MNFNKDVALILKELMKWDCVAEAIINSDLESDKEYDFDCNTAIEKIQSFIEENLK